MFFKNKKEKSKLIDIEKYHSWINDHGTKTNIHDLPNGRYLTILYKNQTKVFLVYAVNYSNGGLSCHQIDVFRKTPRDLKLIDGVVVDVNRFKVEFHNPDVPYYTHDIDANIIKDGKAIWDCAVKVDNS